MTAPPAVSVLIPAYRHAPYAAAAVEAIWAQRAPVEIVACDDASPDGTAAALEALAARSPVPMTVLRNPRNRGVCATLNRCYAHARGALVATTASDDAWMPGYLEGMRAVLAGRARPTVAQSGAWSAAPDAPPRRRLPPRAEATADEARADLAHGRFFMMATSLIAPRAAFEAVGPWDERLSFEDLDFMLRAAAAGLPFAWARAPLVARRVTPGSLSATMAGRLGDMAACYRRGFADRPDLRAVALRRRLREAARVAARQEAGVLREVAALAAGPDGPGLTALARPVAEGLVARLARAGGGGSGLAARWRGRRDPPAPPLPL